MADKRKWAVWILADGATTPASDPWTHYGPTAHDAAVSIVEWLIRSQNDCALTWIDSGPVRVDVRENGDGPLWEFAVTAKMVLGVDATEWMDDDDAEEPNG